MKEIRTEIQINTSAEKIWNTLTLFDKYPDWNPFIKTLKGELKQGKQLEVYLTPPNSKGMTFTPTVLDVQSNKTFRWKGKLLIKGLFDGEHIFEIHDNKNGSCIFVHREEFSGILVPFLKDMLDNSTRHGFELMNRALKKKCEEAV